MGEHRSTRREFLKQTAVGLAAAGMAPTAAWAAAGEGEGVPTRDLGKTGVKVSMLGLGGFHIGTLRDDQESIRLIRQAIDMGVTFLDNAWEYHSGRSEDLVGRALQDGYRQKAFVMTKHHGRDKATALQHLEDSLRRLRTDVIDLWQFHEVIYERDPDMIFTPGTGGIEAAIEAKKQGKVRFIGFTGHKDPAVFKAMLKHDFAWDAVQMPLSVLDAHFKSFEKEILPVLVERKIAPIAMKTMASGYVLKTNTVAPDEALRYVWSLPVATIVSGMQNADLLNANVKLARAFKPMSKDEQAAVLEKTRAVAMEGKFEPFKTTRQFDGSIGRKLHGIS
jgi:aryl-alcohol dehydrogenase-like predicted oxidoreductase